MTEKILQPTKFEHNKSNYLKNSLAIAVTVLVLLVAAATFAREEVIDGQLEPDRITDTEAWEQLFLLLSPKGDHRWVNEGFMDNWLAEGGLSQHEAQRVVAAAWRHLGDPEVHQLDNDILETVNKGRNDRKVDELIRVKKAKLYGQVMELARELPTLDNVNHFLHHEVKSHTTSHQQAMLRTLFPVLYAQGGMSGTVTRSIVVSRSGRYLATKGAANTGGAFGHTTKIAVKAISPSGRTVSAISSTAYSVTATAYIDLCGLICEDGWYSSSLMGNIYCRYGGSFPAYSQAGPKIEQKKFTTLDSIRFTSTTSSAGNTITSMPRTNGTAYLFVKISKSSNCTEVTNLPAETVFMPDSILKTASDPVKKDVPYYAGQLYGEKVWKLQTAWDNQYPGWVDVSTSIGQSTACPPIEWRKTTNIQVR